jgi:hypothetical protein
VPWTRFNSAADIAGFEDNVAAVAYCRKRERDDLVAAVDDEDDATVVDRADA